MRHHPNDPQIRLASATLRRPLLAFIVLFGLAASLLLLDQYRLIQPLRERTSAALLPALQTLAGVRTRVEQIGNEALDGASLRQENDALKAEIARLKADLAKAEPLMLENSRLRQQLQIQEQNPWQLIGAEVSAFTPDAARRTITIARGSNDGVLVGMAVIAQEGTSPPSLVGIVEQVGLRSATVLLITDYSSSVSAQVYNDTTMIQGLIHGQWQRGSRLHLEQIPRTFPLNVGDVVLTAGLSQQTGARLPLAAVPRGVPVGTISAIRPSDYTQTAEVQPFVDPDQIRYVWIILSHDD